MTKGVQIQAERGVKPGTDNSVLRLYRRLVVIRHARIDPNDHLHEVLALHDLKVAAWTGPGAWVSITASRTAPTKRKARSTTKPLDVARGSERIAAPDRLSIFFIAHVQVPFH